MASRISSVGLCTGRRLNRALLDLLVAPRSHEALTLALEEVVDSEIVSGELRGDSASYPVRNGIPRFVVSTDEGQAQTAESFGFKWAHTDTYSSPEMRANSRKWMLERYGFSSTTAMRDHFAALGTVLDAGCGGGFTSSLWLDEGWSGTWVGADISSAVDVARERLSSLPGTHFVQADVLDLPFRDGTFGAVFSEGVLHHTPSTERAFHAVARLLRPGGELHTYVYRRKAPVRELADDLLRIEVSKMSPEHAWESMRPLTKLAQALAELNVEVDVPEDVPLLGIRAGRHDVQRLVYWHFAKLFWNPSLSLDENLHINFDWYHPRYAHRQTEEELRAWTVAAGLEVVRLDVNEPAGYTLRARRPIG